MSKSIKCIGLICKMFLAILLFNIFFITFDVSATTDTNYFSGGEGTAENPYLIATADDFNNIAFFLESGQVAYYKQTNDIIDGHLIEQPIGTLSKPFKGTYDGGGYTIANINQHVDTTINSVETAVCGGLFGYNQGVIKNVCLKNSNFFLNYNVNVTTNSFQIFCGGIVAYNEGLIDRCYLDSTSITLMSVVHIPESIKKESIFYTCAGGIAAYNNQGYITNCGVGTDSSILTESKNSNFSTKKETHITVAGGIVGYNYGKISTMDPTYNGLIKNCYNKGFVTSMQSIMTEIFYPLVENGVEYNAGGIAGSNFGYIGTCYSTGIISANAIDSLSNVGAIVGFGHLGSSIDETKLGECYFSQGVEQTKDYQTVEYVNRRGPGVNMDNSTCEEITEHLNYFVFLHSEEVIQSNNIIYEETISKIV